MAVCERCGKWHDGSFGSGRFCNRSCANARDHSDETKRKISSGVLYTLEHPETIEERYYRRIAEKKIGRKLEYDECVHHVDGDHSNNDPDNLDVMTRAEHASLHMVGREVSIQTRERISSAMSGEKNPNYGKLSGEENPFFGRHHTEESKELMRISIRETLARKNNIGA